MGADLVVLDGDVNHVVERPVDGNADTDESAHPHCDGEQLALGQLDGRLTLDLGEGELRLAHGVLLPVGIVQLV